MTKRTAKALFDFLSQHPGELEVQTYCGEDSNYEEVIDVIVLNGEGIPILSVDRDGNCSVRVVVGHCKAISVS